MDPPGGDEGRQVRLPHRLPPQVPQHRHPRHPRQRGRGPLRRGDRGARHQVKQDVIVICDTCACLLVFRRPDPDIRSQTLAIIFAN